MNPRGSALCKVATFVLLALCLWGLNGVTIGSAGPDHGSLASPKSVAVYPWQTSGLSLALSDFDGDHKIDVAVGRQMDNDYAIVIRLTSRPDETILKSSRLSAGFPILVCDINKDSFSDIVVASPFDAHPLAVWLGDGKGGFSAADQTRFSNNFGLTSSPSYDRQCFVFQHEVLPETRRLGCENQAFAFGNLKPVPRRFTAVASFPYLQRTGQSVVGPRSPPDCLPL